MAKKNRILVPIGGSVSKFGLEFEAKPSNPANPNKGPCIVLVKCDGEPFEMEPSKKGSASSNWVQRGPVLLRYEGTEHAKEVGHDARPQQRVAVIAFREPQVEGKSQPSKKKKMRTSKQRMERRWAGRSAQTFDE